MEGFLWKHSKGWISSWDYIYFYNVQHQLIYKKEGTDISEGFIPIDPDTKIRIGDVVKDPSMFGFEIEVPGRIYSLCCEKRETKR